MGRPSDISRYGCSNWNESGPEIIYKFTLARAANVHANLVHSSADLDVFLLSACDPSACLSYGDTSAQRDSAPPGTYYVVVDGADGASGDFTLRIGWDSDFDGLDDYREDVDNDGQVDPGETNPYLADTDGDGLRDNEDPVPFVVSNRKALVIGITEFKSWGVKALNPYWPQNMATNLRYLGFQVTEKVDTKNGDGSVITYDNVSGYVKDFAKGLDKTKDVAMVYVQTHGAKGLVGLGLINSGYWIYYGDDSYSGDSLYPGDNRHLTAQLDDIGKPLDLLWLHTCESWAYNDKVSKLGAGGLIFFGGDGTTWSDDGQQGTPSRQGFYSAISAGKSVEDSLKDIKAGSTNHNWKMKDSYPGSMYLQTAGLQPQFASGAGAAMSAAEPYTPTAYFANAKPLLTDSDGDGIKDQIKLTWDVDTSLPQEEVLVHVRLYDAGGTLSDERIVGPYTTQGTTPDSHSLDFYVTRASTYRLAVDLYGDARRFSAGLRLGDIVAGPGPGRPGGTERFTRVEVQAPALAVGNPITVTWEVTTTAPQEAVTIIVALKSSADVAQEAVAVSGPHSVTPAAPIHGNLVLTLPSTGIYDLALSLLDSTGHLEESRNLGLWATGRFADRGADSNGDGRFESLLVDVGVRIPAPGDYLLRGNLHDSAGNLVATGTTGATMGRGEQMLTLSFDGASIFKSGASGPFTLRNLELQSRAPAAWGLIDNAWTTAIYDYRQFGGENAALAGKYSDSGTDANGNGAFDYLTIGVALDVPGPGHYTVEASLLDSQRGQIGRESTSADLGAGPQIMTLRFAGRAIAAREADGPYILGDLTLWIRGNDGLDRVVDYEQEAYVTGDYLHTQFESPVHAYLPLVGGGG